MSQLKYLNAYPDHLKQQVTQLLKDEKLGAILLGKYPQQHEVRTDRALYTFAIDLKNDYLRKSAPISKVIYDDKISVTRDALGLHTQISRVQGNKLKSKNEIRIDSIFKRGPEAFLRMIVGQLFPRSISNNIMPLPAMISEFSQTPPIGAQLASGVSSVA